MKKTYEADIKHFLNPKEITRTYADGDYHPLDLQIVYRGESIQIRSKIRDYLNFYRSDVKKVSRNDPKQAKYIMMGYFTHELFDEIINERIFPVYDLLVDEAALVQKVITFNEPFDNHHFTTRNFTREYTKHTTEIAHLLDDRMKELYLKEVNGLFAKSIDPAKSKEVFKISNYFIHYIHWDNTFANFYENTFEVMPKGLKLIENYFSEPLKTSIKAYMAFTTQVKIIRRQFEKVEPGKISVLSYFEWLKLIQSFISLKFEKIFGKKKANEYIDSLHKVLYNYMLESYLKA